MITFNRQNLIDSQNSKFNRIYRDINFFIWLGWGLATIIAAVVMYFFSITIGIWIEAVVVFTAAVYYMMMSFIKERMALGYYQQAKEIEVSWTADGLVLKEKTKTDENIYMLASNQIYRVIEYRNYFVIMMKDEGRVTLPNTENTLELKDYLKGKLKSNYRVYES